MPKREPAPPLTVLYDTREQCVPEFPAGVILERATMATGDYTTPGLRTIAAIERKSVGDFASTITWGRERFDREVVRFQPIRFKCVVVEGDIGDAWRVCQVHPHAVIGTVASLFARYQLPVLFAGTAVAAGRLMAGLLSRWEQLMGLRPESR
jgi:DNA excision repair protein ERCC-4